VFETHWCDQCNVPVLSGICGNCGKKLNSRMPDNLRPVFREELELLEKTTGEDLKEFSDFSLWANRRTYYWMGKPLFVVNGGNLLTNPTISWKRKNRESVDQPFSIEVFRKANSGPVRSLTEEAKQFIEETYRKYREDVDLTTVAFSGGKDSTVILDLAGKALKKDSYKVIFIDTKFELPDTYEYVNEMAKQYEILKSEPKREPIDLWREMLPPSRTIRWCCYALKTGPYEMLVKKVSGKNNTRMLTFEGIRSEESFKRAKYPRIDFESKIHSQISVRPIFEWSSIEVWTYILQNRLSYNKAYEYGFERVGCLYCPFGSKRDDHMVSVLYNDSLAPFLSVLRDFAAKAFIDDIDDYLKNMQWKKRRGGKRSEEEQNLRSSATEEEISYLASKFISYSDLEMFLKPIGNLTVILSSESERIYQIDGAKFGTAIVVVQKEEEGTAVRLQKSNVNISKINKLLFYQLNKILECVCCGYCESICPVNAISVSGKTYRIDSSKCLSCGKCIDSVSYGCLSKLSKAIGGKSCEYKPASDFRFKK